MQDLEDTTLCSTYSDSYTFHMMTLYAGNFNIPLMGVLAGLQKSNCLYGKTLYPGNSAQIWFARNVAYQNHKKGLVWANRNYVIG